MLPVLCSSVGSLAGSWIAATAAAVCSSSSGRRLLHSFPGGSLERAAAAGQPTHFTHPEVLDQGQVAPGLHYTELAQRRQNLANLMPPGSLAVIPAASLAFVTGVIPYPYRQDADFLYLTGLQQQAVALIRSGGNGEHEFQLYIPSPDSEKERWDGAWVGEQAAQQVFKADVVHNVLELPERVQQLSASATSVLFDFDRLSGYQYTQLRQALAGAAGRGKSVPLKPTMHRLRWVKSAAELGLMRTSANIAAHAQRRCMQLSHVGVHERALATEFEYSVKMAGASRLAYPTMAGGGADTCTIHYSRNDKRVHGGQIVLMDAGCEYFGYASDVTRTWPVDGRYTPEQRRVYETVLSVRQQCLAEAYPGNTLAKLHSLSVSLLSEGIRDLGILPGASLEDIQRGLYRDFYCHSVGHYLGLDVHDTNTIGPYRTLEPGVVLAIEPGLYIPNHPQFGPYAGIGVRIEDDVLITQTGCEVLSAGVPVEPDEVEALVNSPVEAAGGPLWRPGPPGSSDSESEPQEPAVAAAAAVA